MSYAPSTGGNYGNINYPNYWITPNGLGNPTPYYTPQQAQYQANVQKSIKGRMIFKPEDVTPNEVPMDGSVGLFPKNDYSEIYAKSWNSDGTIRTVKFTPEKEQDEKKVDFNAEIIKRLDKIEKSLNTTNARSKKEAGASE